MLKGTTVELDMTEYSGLINRLKFFQKIIQEISARKPLQQLLDQIILSSKKLLDAEAASLLLVNPLDQRLYFHTIAGGKSSSLKSKALEVGQGIGGWVAENKESIIINDCYSDPRFDREFDKDHGYHTRNMICVPMINKESLVGVIQVINKNEDKSFSREDLELFQALAAQCAVAIENARTIELELKEEQTKNELETAWRIQKKFLPQNIPVIKNVRISIELQPAKQIGGDYFNVIKIDEENYLFFIADVTGKSVSAALIVSTIYSFLQFYFILQKSVFDPKDFVKSFNEFLVASTTPDKFVTAWFGFYNETEKRIVSINAGHNPPYLLKVGSDSVSLLQRGGFLLGCFECSYQSENILLDTGDMIVFYTDGIPEAMNMSNEEFGEERFIEMILSKRKLQPDSLSKVILEELKKYRGEAEQSDDITLGILKFN